jgi:hypothetical protein
MSRDVFTTYPFTAPSLNGKSALNAKFTFNEMAGMCAAAKVRATVGTDPRRIRLTRTPGLLIACRLQSERSKSVPLSPRGFCAGRGAEGRGGSTLLGRDADSHAPSNTWESVQEIGQGKE